MGGLGDDDHAALEQEAEGRLCRGLAVAGRHCAQHRIVEVIVSALRKRAPGFDLRPIALHHSFGGFLLLEQMRLHLIHRRSDFTEVGKVDEAVRIKVGNADGPHTAFPVRLLHGPVGAVVIAKGLVNQQQVNVFSIQFF